MPTAAKLVSALLFGLLGYIAAALIVPHLPEGTQIGLFREVSGVIGLAVGWRFVGRWANDTVAFAIGYGLTGAAMVVFWGLLIFSGEAMLQRALDKRYGGAVEAILAQFEIAWKFAVLMATPVILGWLIIGGAIFGLIAALTARMWK